MLHQEAEGRPKRDGVGEVPSIRAHARAQPRPLGDGDAGVEALADVEAPRIVEVVLGAGPLEGRGLLAVHVEEVVALPEPARLRLYHRHHRPHVVAAPCGGEDLVGPASRVGQGLPVAGVEVRRVVGQRRPLLPIHLVVEVVHTAAALVGHRDAARLPEGHRPIAVPRAPLGAVANHVRLHGPLEAVAHREEVPQGSVDAGDGTAVVVHTQAEKARPAILARGHGEPDVGDHARALQIREHGGLAGDRPLAVVVRGRVRRIRRRPARDEVLRLEEAEGVEKGLIPGEGARPGQEQRDQGQQAPGHREAPTKTPVISVRPAPSTRWATRSRALSSPTMWSVRWRWTSDAPGARAAAGDEVSSS